MLSTIICPSLTYLHAIEYSEEASTNSEDISDRGGREDRFAREDKFRAHRANLSAQFFYFKIVTFDLTEEH